jgi:murein L,D-transpeptidase YafK
MNMNGVAKQVRWYVVLGLLLVVVLVACAFLVKTKPDSAYLLIPKRSVSHLVVYKQERRLEVWNHDTLIRTMKICLGQVPLGPKRQEGDSKTPEGVYQLDYANPNSSFYRSFHISYPNKADQQRAKRMRVSPGGFVMLHGCGVPGYAISQREGIDWTDGCIAVSDAQMDTLWAWIKVPTKIDIRP